MSRDFEDQAAMILAAEDCEPDRFEQLHTFSASDERILLRLMAHGPVLLRGGRGTGKSALMIEASRRLAPHISNASAFGIYLSLRHLGLLRAKEGAYERLLCQLLIESVKANLTESARDFDPAPDAASVQQALSRLASSVGKRIVLFFDDAAHLGREASLADFFDTYRTLSSSAVSCKATIYPGVTRFGNRFDVYNDATVVDLARNEELPGFSEFFADVLSARYPDSFGEKAFSRSLTKQDVAGFLGRSVLGNMRAFIFTCNSLKDICGDGVVGLPELGNVLLSLAQNYYWPLLDEIRPKLGMYEPLVEPAIRIAESIFEVCGQKAGNPRTVLIHRDILERLAKPFEMLEYSGFISKREASRAMKSGGRGGRYALNLCNLLEQTPGARLTKDLFDRWRQAREEPVEFHKAGGLGDIQLPQLKDVAELEILGEPIEKLAKSQAYPYGLTENKINVLRAAGFHTVGDLANAKDAELDALDTVGEATVARIRNVLGQAVWM